MTWNEIVMLLLKTCLIPMFGIAIKYLVQFLEIKVKETEKHQDDELYYKYKELLEDTIEKCVIATNQTYTNSLKESNSFTREAQKEAFEKTYNSVMTILSKDAKIYLTEAFGDLETYLQTQIEAYVSKEKK